MAKKTIIINRKEYTMPAIGIDEYLNYLDVREGIMDVEGRKGMYTKQQFLDMIGCICELYGNQFTKEELMDRGTGLSVSQIILEFVSIEAVIGKEVDESIEELKKNFQSGR